MDTINTSKRLEIFLCSWFVSLAEKFQQFKFQRNDAPQIDRTINRELETGREIQQAALGFVIGLLAGFAIAWIILGL